jgi:TatD DNase family protein
MIQLTDTHCHIHEAERGYEFSTETKKKYQAAGSPSPDTFIKDAREAGVTKLLCVGTTVEDSELAVTFVQSRPGTWASIGIHPHEAQRYAGDPKALARFAALADKPKVIAIGECGLDFFYDHSPHDAQEKILRFQIELALKHDLPIVFHVRGAFKEFWPIFDSYKGIRGVIHSFSSDKYDLDEILKRGLYVGLNGITTFMKAASQIAAVKQVPIDRLVLETDAPFLTPTPYRGRLCEPKHVRVTAEFLADLRGESLDDLAERTNANVQKLFGLKNERQPQ